MSEETKLGTTPDPAVFPAPVCSGLDDPTAFRPHSVLGARFTNAPPLRLSSIDWSKVIPALRKHIPNTYLGRFFRLRILEFRMRLLELRMRVLEFRMFLCKFRTSLTLARYCGLKRRKLSADQGDLSSYLVFGCVAAIHHPIKIIQKLRYRFHVFELKCVAGLCGRTTGVALTTQVQKRAGQETPGEASQPQSKPKPTDHE